VKVVQGDMLDGTETIKSIVSRALEPEKLKQECGQGYRV